MKKLHHLAALFAIALSVALPLQAYAGLGTWTSLYVANKLVKAVSGDEKQSTPRQNGKAIPLKEASVTQGRQNPDCDTAQPRGMPVTASPVVKRSYFLCRMGYASQYDPETKTPLWVAERINKRTLEGSASRDDETFAEDPQIPSHLQASLDDYTTEDVEGDRYDRGHLAPAADFKWSQTAMSQSFLLTNIVPQAPRNNRGVWSSLEGMVREMAMRRGEMYVVTGPVYLNSKVTTLGRNEVRIPNAMFKILIDPARGEMTGFIIPNNNSVGDDPAKYQFSVRDVERVTGINFNPSLDRGTADVLETRGGNWILPKVRTRNRS